MRLTAQEAIAYLRPFVRDDGGPRFYVVPEPTAAAADAQALSFMERCWNSAVEHAADATASASSGVVSSSGLANEHSDTAAAGTLPVEAPQLPPVNFPENASVVFYDAPSFASPITPSAIPSDAGYFFSAAVVPAEQNTDGRRGRNGIAWVVL
ncbi:uncharacterized protein Tco025E_01564 [Trypanosoma conorhini]|uniref:Uncharacterized protein n=1 Tax=Trypanosoma conorhini TaxID=83891 RepID=A0A422Q885_9TRYP|nr:uncharacterized protein Tco025E_01564 [Trypanosoma conorhini]RNF26164.1 hypothetical protein Tco025E_01564 [Trypanosoma conorhini]